MRFILFFVLILSSLHLKAQDTTRLSFLFTGDIMGHDSQIASAYDKASNTYNYNSCFQFVKPYIESADLAIGNLEVTLAGPPYKGYPQFSSPDELAVTLKDVGFDVLVTANNHSVDRGRKGIERTIKVLDSLDIPHTGTFVGETDRLNNYPLLLHKNGFTIALLNYTYGTNGIPVPSPTIVNPIDTSMIRKDIAVAKKHQPDIIIAFIHWGVEYENLPRKNQKDLTGFLFKQNVDLVIGAHPHVLQPMEWRKEKDKLVVYSLGNFVSGQRKQYTDGGAMAYVEMKKIRYKPDSIVTSIDSAGYFLQWVYRTEDVHKDYYILPTSSFERDQKLFIKGEESKLAFKTFVSDSRNLYGKHNVNVREIKTVPADSSIQYKIALMVPEYKEETFDESSLKNLIDPLYGVEIVVKDDHDPVFWIGPINSRQKADKMCSELIVAGRNAQVIREVRKISGKKQ